MHAKIYYIIIIIIASVHKKYSGSHMHAEIYIICSHVHAKIYYIIISIILSIHKKIAGSHMHAKIDIVNVSIINLGMHMIMTACILFVYG